MKVTPYLNYEGNAEEVMNFYKEVFEANEMFIMRYNEAPDMEVPENHKEKILHGSLMVGEFALYFSDVFPGTQLGKEGNIELAITCESEEELRKLFARLVEGGDIKMNIEEMFWGAIFGSVKDKYGLRWSLNFEKKK